MKANGLAHGFHKWLVMRDISRAIRCCEQVRELGADAHSLEAARWINEAETLLRAARGIIRKNKGETHGNQAN